FPQFANSRPVCIELHPGEMLFLPAFWWHDVVSIGENVAVNFWWQLATDREMANLGRAFAAFQDAVKAVPPEWGAHMRRLSREFLCREAWLRARRAFCQQFSIDSVWR